MSYRVRGLAAAIAGSVLLAGGFAMAHGPTVLPTFQSGDTGAGNGSGFSSFFSPAPAPSAETVRRSYYEEDRASQPKRKRAVAAVGGHSAVAAFGYGKPVCVRLCDGAFFPTASVAGGDAACASQCPDAPTALYTMSTDRIEDAVSSTGKPYSQLPVAKRFEASVENTCSCHREGAASRVKQLLHDPTLRKGDVVMTSNGFRVYEGSGYSAVAEKDFVTLPKAGDVSKDERAALAAMERASASTGARAPAAPPAVAARPKPSVTVDDGDPTPPAKPAAKDGHVDAVATPEAVKTDVALEAAPSATAAEPVHEAANNQAAKATTP